MFKKIFLLFLVCFSTACGSEKLDEGVYRMYLALTETNVPGESPWPVGVFTPPTFWSLKKVQNQPGRWLRYYSFPEGLKESKDNGKFLYSSLDWSEWSEPYASTSVVLEVEPTTEGFKGEMFYDNPDGNRVYSLDSTWICENGVGVGCGDGVW